MKNALPLLVLCSLVAAACGGSPDSADDGMTREPTVEAPIGSVTITEPVDGAEVTGPNITVRLAASGMEIIPAGEMIQGAGHHHLYLDADVTEREVPVPTVPRSIVHLGDGASEFTFQGVAPGQHRLIAVVADGVHVPLYPWVVDTVTFTVR